MDIIQTHDGYIWCATQDGIARFDGVRFVIFDTGNTPGMASNSVEQLTEDGEGDLWAAGEGGVSRFHNGICTNVTPVANGERDYSVECFRADDGSVWAHGKSRIYHAEHGRLREVFDLDDWDPSATLLAWMIDSEGTVWAASSSGKLFHPSGRSQVYTLATRTLDITWRIWLAQDKSGQVWVSCPDGLFSAQESRLRRVASYPQYRSDSNGLVCDNNNRLWCLNDGRLYRADGAGLHAFEKSSVIDGHILALDHQGNLVCYSGPNWGWSRQGEIASVMVGSALQTFSVKDSVPGVIRCIEHDSRGDVWIGSDNGLQFVREAKCHTFSNGEGLPGSIVSACATRDGGIVATVLGQGTYRLAESRFHPLWPHHPLYYLQQAPDGTLLGETDYSIYAYRGGRFVNENARIGIQPGEKICCFTVADNGDIWLAEPLRLIRLRHGVRTVFPLPPAPRWMFAIHVDRDGTLWCGATDGLFRVNRDHLTHFTSKDGLPDSSVCAIFDDSAGMLWLGQWGGGLTRFADGKFSNIRVRDGLSSDNVFQIIEDGQQNLWIGSSKGVFSVSADELNAVADGDRYRRLHCISYGPADGASGGRCTAGSPNLAAQSPNGDLWFSGQNGLVAIDAAYRDTDRAPLRIEQAVVDGRRYATKSGLILPPGSGNIEIDFTAIEFRSPNRLHLRYLLDGRDDRWNDCGALRQAVYTHLPPGHYVFRAEAVSDDGPTSVAALFAFTIRPYWYQSDWFKIAVAALIIAGIILIFRIRTVHLRRRTIELESIVNERTAELKAANAQLHALATTDGLTGLTNHRSFQDQLEQEWLAWDRQGAGAPAGCSSPTSAPLSLLLIDVDKFKQYNDTYGHPAGDDVLRTVARILREAARQTDVVARYGGEEFVVILRETNAHGVAIAAERFRSAVESHDWPERVVTISIGAATAVADMKDRAALIAAADSALYRSKENGRNRSTYYNVDDPRSAAA